MVLSRWFGVLVAVAVAVAAALVVARSSAADETGYARFAAALTEVCDPAAADVAAVTDRLVSADVDVDGYIAEVAEVAAAVGDAVDGLAPFPVGLESSAESFAGGASSFAAALSAAPEQGAVSAEQALAQMGSAASGLGVASCVDAVPVSPQRLLADSAAQVDVPVTDAAAAGQLWAFGAVNSAGVDSATGFGVPATLEGFADGLDAVAGDVEASPEQVSVSAASLADPAEPPGPDNVWVVGFAVRDTDGVCVYGRLWGFPRLTAYEAADAGGAVCTGDAAAASASLLMGAGS